MMNRKKITIGVLGLGVAGAMVGGVGVATAAGSNAGPAAASPRLAATSVSMPCWGDDGILPGRNARSGAAFEAAAKYLGLAETQLRARLQDGSSLADVARAQGKSVSGLVDAIVAAVRERVQANTRLTVQQRTALLEQLRTRVAAMVNAAHEPGARMGFRLGIGMGPGMGNGMGRMGR